MGIATINRDAIYTPRRGEVILVRGNVSLQGNNHTTQWGFQMTQAGMWVPGSNEFGMQLVGKIIGSSLLTAEDDRIAQQRKSIDLMLDHLKIHCPKLNGTGECEHITKPQGVVHA